MPIPASILTLVAGAVLALLGLWVGQTVNLLPTAASDNAAAVDDLFKVLFSVGSGLLLGITALLLIALVRFRRQKGDRLDGLATEGNLPLEIFWTAVPAIVVLIIGVYSYDVYSRMGGMADLGHGGMVAAEPMVHDARQASLGHPPDTDTVIWGGIDNTERQAFPVEVTAMQFAFIFHYPQQNFTTGELHLPEGRPVALRLTAKDVIHAFWVPEFRLKQDAIPGQPTMLSFTPNRQGSFDIVCAELCGPYHGGMRSKVIVEAPDEFETWLASNTPTTIAEVVPQHTTG